MWWRGHFLPISCLFRVYMPGSHIATWSWRGFMGVCFLTKHQQDRKALLLVVPWFCGLRMWPRTTWLVAGKHRPYNTGQVRIFRSSENSKVRGVQQLLRIAVLWGFCSLPLSTFTITSVGLHASTLSHYLKPVLTYERHHLRYLFTDQEGRTLKWNAHQFVWIPGDRIGPRW